MDGRNIEPWVPAILEDTSNSGACVRMKRPLAVGSLITVKWHREQFSAVPRNCRIDGGDFLLGVRREAGIASAIKSPAAPVPKLDGSEQAPLNLHKLTPILLLLRRSQS
jgi:hypothetical protein